MTPEQTERAATLKGLMAFWEPNRINAAILELARGDHLKETGQ